MGKINLFKADYINSTKGKNFTPWINYVKGIAIILVLIAHDLEGDNWLNIWIYSFHMPVFMVLSGFLIKETTISQPFSKVLKKYLKSLILPYYLIGFCVLLIEVAKDIIQRDISVKNELTLLFNWIFMIGIKADWFLPCLFFGIIINILLLKLFKGNRIFLAIAVICIAVLCCLVPHEIAIINVLLRGGLASAYICIGILLRDFKNKSPQLLNQVKKYIIPLFILLLAINIALTVVNGKVSFAALSFGKSSILFYINGTVGSIMLMLFCKLIGKFKLKLLNYCGINSIIIMATHMEIMALINTAMEYVLPEKNVVFICISIIVTFIISLLCIPFANKVLSKIR